jgi:hypothetical protein
MSPAPEELHRLRQLVSDHQVVYEVRRLPMGFDIDLYGTHGHRYEHATIRPGCDHCQELWDRLREIAEAALPPDPRASVYRPEGFRPGLTYDPKRHPRADVELVLQIRHRHDYNAVVDPCEQRCRDEIVARLRSLGVREGTWPRGVTVPITP